jgi:hypothetical protein
MTSSISSLGYLPKAKLKKQNGGANDLATSTTHDPFHGPPISWQVVEVKPQRLGCCSVRATHVDMFDRPLRYALASSSSYDMTC